MMATIYTRGTPSLGGNLLDDGGPLVLRPRAVTQAPEEERVQPAPIPPPKPPAPVEVPNAMAPRLAGESIRILGAGVPGRGCAIHGASIRRTQHGYTLEGRTDTQASIALRAALGTVVGVPFRGVHGEEVVVALYMEGITVSSSAKVREGMEVELRLMLPHGLIFGSTL